MKFEATPQRLCALLFFAAASVYWNTLSGEFVLDDLIQIVHNTSIHTFTGTLRSLFLPTYPGDLYRPVTGFSYGLTYSLFGPDPYWFHLFNVLLHSANVALVFLLLLRCVSAPLAAWSALFFAVLPIHTEAVANVCGRTELLSAFFGFAFLNLLPPRAEPRIASLPRAFLLGVLLFLSIASKESGIVFPLLGFLVLWKEEILKKEGLAVVAAVVIGVVPYAVLRIGVLGHLFVPGVTEFVDNPLIALSWHDRMVSALTLLGKYVYLSFFPWPLSADYSYAALEQLLHAAPFECAALWILVIGLLLLALYESDQRESKFFARWFFLAFVLTANFFLPIGTVFGERLAYVPSVAMCGILALFVSRSCPLRSQELVFTVLALIYSAVTLTHNEVWRNNESLSRYQRAVAPQSVKSLTNFAVVLRNLSRYDDAMHELALAERIMPRYDQIPFLRATILIARGNTDAAQVELSKTLGLNPHHVEALRLLGTMHLNSGDLFAAERSFRHVLTIDPESFEGSLGLFAVDLKGLRIEKASREYAKLIARAPDNAELKRLGSVLRAMEEERKRGAEDAHGL